MGEAPTSTGIEFTQGVELPDVPEGGCGLRGTMPALCSSRT